MSRTAAAILSTAALFLALAVAAAPPRGTDVVSLKATAANRSALARSGLDLLMEWEGRIFVALGPGPGSLSRLRGLNLPFRFERPLGAARPDAGRNAASTQGGLNGAYHSSAETEQELLSLERDFPAVARVVRLGTSLEGRAILAVKISDNPGLDEDEPEVLILGCHHAREWISVEVPLLFARRLAEGYAADPALRARVDAAETWILPLVNPDGLEYSIQTYRWWRKNRRASGDGSFGVDLNRNYGYMWGADDDGSSPSPFSEVYRGAAPFSEPETQAVRDLCAARSFLSVLSFHSYGQLILYPWGWTDRPSPRAEADHALAARLAEIIRGVNGREYAAQPACALYLTNGDTVDYVGGTLGVPAFTVELPPLDMVHGAFMNAEADIASVFAENLPALLYLVDEARGRHAAAGAGGDGRASQASRD